jgi:NAD(P)-dependent dehydrogenase (short-subunit alcohol dehydrogenase family)
MGNSSKPAGAVEVLSCDLGQTEQVERLAQLLIQRSDVPAALVCNAGVALDGLSTLTNLAEAQSPRHGQGTEPSSDKVAFGQPRGAAVVYVAYARHLPRVRIG